MDHMDTIVAVATPPGRGGVGIVRVSGARSRYIAKQIIGACPAPRHAVFRRFADADGAMIDEGIALFFSGPNSFTGEDVLELHGHGGPQVMDLLVQRALKLGARSAAPGEFSLRAFLNGRLDLVQAEAIADLIDSGSEQAARAAARSLQGEFSRLVLELLEALTDLRTYVEAAIDFPDEEIDFLADTEVSARLADVFAKFDFISAQAQQGRLLREGMRVVLAGRPNAGKSSLMNQLAGHEAAIVADEPGTTRDVLREEIQIDGMPLHIVDTAGLRDSADKVEKEGVRRARAEAANADLVLLLVDASEEGAEEHEQLSAALPDGVPITRLRNKIDLSEEPAGLQKAQPPTINISAKTGAGLSALRAHLKSVMGYRGAEGGAFSARRRHTDALERARQHTAAGRRQLVEGRAGELLAEELRLAQLSLSEITGEFTSDDLLGRIFSSFCVGK
ncbi:MAG: tRNA uridine-5-carboxymethylaminomethyl(34) synthesis GTPase MnmE [Gammaproteobacteria bacterium]|nr:tRNA uridine-5-carboxymethylaminomethyl(34) synthesis GTPase MnmE [Gammaproteobacteria bacterium]